MSGTSAMAPVVDVVIDNYNYATFLEEAIESARLQTHPAVNVIVVDDGSDDGSRAILDAQPEEVTVVLKENGGQASALNTGMEHSRGDVVIFLDADDRLHPQAAARVAATFAADPALAKVQCRMDTIDASGNRLVEVKPPPHLTLPEGDMRQAELAYPFDLTWMAMSANAFRAESLRRILPIPEAEYRICADWYLVHLTALLGPVASLEQIGASYRIHGANSYERQAAAIDLDHIRQTIGLAEATVRELERLADEIALARPRNVLSLWILALRLLSLRIEPAAHPVAGDSAVGILRDAIRAARRRSDATAAKKLLFLGWFAATATCPRRLVPRLGELFLFPERRSSLNRLLGRLQRRAAATI
ncbi:MAG: glycosyltransferase family 2 protein [Solirubrobacterales bacterium]